MVLSDRDNTSLLPGEALERTGWSLPPDARSWLERSLRQNPTAPRIPVSDLERAARALGLTYDEICSSPPKTGDFVQGQMRVLFPLARMRALRKWLVRSAKAQENPADSSAAEAVLNYLRSFDRPSTRPRRNAIFDILVSVSLEEALGFDTLNRRLSSIRRRPWPARHHNVRELERKLRWVDVRVPPVDLLPALCALDSPSKRASQTSETHAEPLGQLLLLGTTPPAESLDEHCMDEAGREALASDLELWARQASVHPPACEFARNIEETLRGGTGQPDALDVLVRMSALEIPRRASAAEQARLDAVLSAQDDDPSALVDYGDYLARAQRTQEAVRAYERARLRVPPAERDAIDERLRAREERLERVPTPVWGARPDPDQLRLLLGTPDEQ